MTEVWKDIKGYEGLYQVSNQGNVRSKDRRAVNHRNGSTRFVPGIVMNPWDNGNGYLVVSLHDKRRRKNHYVHRLVAEAFVDNPDGKMYINHKDYNKHNNNFDNIEWCTQKENVAHSIEHLRKPRSKFKHSNTGEKYIGRRNSRGRIYYRVVIKQIGVCKQCRTLEDAIRYRNEVMEKWQNQYFKMTERTVCFAK